MSLFTKSTNDHVITKSKAGLLMALVVFLLGMTATGVYATVTRDQNTRDYQAGVSQQARGAETFLDSSMRNYSQVLRSAVALFRVKQDITAEDWQTFYQQIKTEGALDEMLGVGYMPVSNDSQTAIITYLEPTIEPNQRAIGFDMYTDPIRRAAMEIARDTGAITMSAPVALVQDKNEKNPRPGVLIYAPLYDQEHLTSKEERQNALKGYAYIVLRPHNIMSRYEAEHGDAQSRTALSVIDVSGKQAPVTLFASQFGQGEDTSQQFHSVATTDVFGRTWQVDATRSEAYSTRISPAVMFLLGGVVSAILAALTNFFFTNRIRRVEAVYEDEVKRSKDELLALASHQLRTPASAVKQYIGILTSGMMGELTKEQKVIAEKAYETNERQINIINDLLYVSKLDAKQLVIEPREMNLTALVQKSVDDYEQQAAEKNIVLVFRTKRPHIITADSRYLSMAIDNLISNAIKYSYPSTRVIVRLVVKGRMVVVSVRDYGVGLDKDDYEKVFTKFTRIENQLSHDAEGSGLGLFLTRQLVRAHSGDVTVESTPGKGSMFILSLPKELTINTAIVHLNPTLGGDGASEM